MGDGYDAIIVGARCAGSATAIGLARSGAKVLLIDKTTFPSDTISTHYLFPNTLAELDRLGVMDILRARHTIVTGGWFWHGFGHTWGGTYTSFDGYDGSVGIRRITLDAAMVEAAAAAGAETRFGEAVTGLVGAGTEDDPVRGVTLERGETVTAPLVIGADGRRSFVARSLGVRERDERRGGVAFLYAYHEGLSVSDATLQIRPDQMLLLTPNEDGIVLLTLSGGPALTRGTPEEVERRYEAAIRSFPEIAPPEAIDAATRISAVQPVPETMMRGFFRAAAGPGWALVGDAGHFKHPATAQGIGDAVAQARYVSDTLARGDDLSGYEAWRDERSREHYDLSFRFGVLPDEDLAPKYFRGVATDPEASREFGDLFTRVIEPSAFDTPERLARWLA